MTSPSQQTRRRPRPRLVRWVAVAALVHLELLLVVGLAAFFWVPRNAEMASILGGKNGEPETIDIETLDEATTKKILAELDKEDAAKEAVEEEKKKEEEESLKSPGQVVELPKPNEEKRPQNARFAAEYDSSVAKEMKRNGEMQKNARQAAAQEGTAEQNRPAVPATPPAPRTAQTPPGAIAMRAPVGQRGRQGPPAQPGEAAPAVAGTPGEAVEAPPDPNGDLSPPGRDGPARSSGGVAAGAPVSGQKGSNAAPPSLVPSEQQIARAIGSGTNDYVKDIDDGAETALNAKKWKFASFFNRVKQQVRDHWRPQEEYHRRDPSGSIYGQKDRYTLLRVQLKPDGSLANVALETPSGVEFLDDEAIEAFKQAQPFPNPPKQLVESNSGLIDFRFGFFFELSGSPHMKIFKY
jgi:TonB family protein